MRGWRIFVTLITIVTDLFCEAVRDVWEIVWEEGCDTADAITVDEWGECEWGAGAAGAGGERCYGDATGTNATQQQGLSGAEVVALLGTLKGAIEASGISAGEKEDLLGTLKAVTKEAGKEVPDKEFAKANLKKMFEGMKVLNDTTEAGNGLWQTGLEVFKAVGPWVGLAATVFGG